MKHDVIVMGSGIGGLLTAAILSKNGKRVCVVEQNKQIGGNLQTFSRKKQLFDTGVHYIGGLGIGENLYQIFKYLGIIDQLSLKKMNAVFDYIVIENNPVQYPMYQGYNNFIEGLSAYFPEEKNGLQKLCNYMQQVCESYPLYNLHTRAELEQYKGSTQSVKEIITGFIKNITLQKVLVGNSLLYALDENKTPFHVFALILNSYIQSSWKCTNGGGEIAKLLAHIIHQNGGVIKKHCKIIKIEEEENQIKFVEDEQGQKFFADIFVSNIHPKQTLQMLNGTALRPFYKKRIEALENTISSFSIHATLHSKTIQYQNSNFYFQKKNRIWNAVNYDMEEWPVTYGLYFIQDRKYPEFASAISILTYMNFEEMRKWNNSFNTVAKEEYRGEEYEKFKTLKAEKLLSIVQQKFPDIVNAVEAYYAATPITNRDYIGNGDGNMYGTVKNYTDMQQIMISSRTKIDNLFFTGQCMNLHGILGTSLSAILCSMHILKDEKLIENIRNV